MKRKFFTLGLACLFALTWTIVAFAADPVVIGLPTSLGFLEGKESHKVVQMAVGEINAKGGITVGGVKRQLEVAAIDIRDAAPGVPVPEALLGIEKLILEKKPAAIVVGPFRSEALMAGMDLIAKHKVPLLGTIAMSPGSEKKLKGDPEKYKYVFRTCLNSINVVQYLSGMLSSINKQFGFNKIYIMRQDVAWTAGAYGALKKFYLDKQGWEIVGEDAFPTGTQDFSSGLMKVRAKKAQVILPIFDMPQSGILVKQWKSMKIPALMGGFISPLAGPGAWKTFDGKIGGLMNAIFEMGSSMGSPKLPKTMQFLNKYKSTYGKDIQAGHGPAPAYESVYILAEAIERANSLDPDAIVAELEKTDRMGMMGRIRFNDGHQVGYGTDPKESALGAIVQWSENGKRKIVFPPSIADSKIQLPPGLKSLK